MIGASSEESDPRARILARALRILTARPHSEKQLRKRLLANAPAESAAVDECIGRLKELGFIDDAHLAEGYVSRRKNNRPMGRARIARELARKQVEPSAISRALELVFEEGEEEALLDRAIEKRVRTHGMPVDDRGAGRMFDHLARLGFEYEAIVRRIKSLRKSARTPSDVRDGPLTPE